MSARTNDGRVISDFTFTRKYKAILIWHHNENRKEFDGVEKLVIRSYEGLFDFTFSNKSQTNQQIFLVAQNEFISISLEEQEDQEKN